MPRIPSAELQRFTKLKKNHIEFFRYGANLTTSTGYSPDDLVHRVVRDRLTFAASFHRAARKAVAERDFRLGISRGYYSIYHTARALVFFTHMGDDNQEHSELPKHIPPAFPDHTTWQNTIKDARLQRNLADYDPYPANDASFEPVANKLLRDARLLRKAVLTYLISNGFRL